MRLFFTVMFKRCPQTGRIIGIQRSKSASKFAALLIGGASFFWIVVRVLPKPSRATYPCMKVASPAALSFLAYLGSLFVTSLSLTKGKQLWQQTRKSVAVCLILFGISVGLIAFFHTQDELFAYRQPVTNLADNFEPIDEPNFPMGIARGIFPGRVAWAHNPEAVNWDGESGYWWQDANNDQDAINAMLSDVLQSLSGADTDEAAWTAIFTYFNQQHDQGAVGYRAGEKIAIKLNLNKVGSYTIRGNTSFPSPHLVLALVRQLVEQAGVAEDDITLYDVNRVMPDPIYNKVHDAFPGVHYMGNYSGRGRELYVRAEETIHWSQELTMEIGGGHPAYLPTTITEAAYLINLASFKAHRYVGVTACAKNHFGSFSCDDDNGNVSGNAPKSAGLHPYVTVRDFIIPGSAEWSFYGREMNTYNSLVDIMGHKDLGAKTVLFINDALYGVEDEQVDVSLNSKWLSSPFNNDWTSSLFASLDDVALSSVGVDFYCQEQILNENVYSVQGSVDNYLHEAAMAPNSPSGVLYDPEADGTFVTSLGVHEHWNNPEDKQYSRNLGTGKGIELVYIGASSAVEDGPVSGLPEAMILHANYPNPFNPSTTIRYEVPMHAYVWLTIYDTTGKEVARPVHENQDAGMHEVLWNGQFENGLMAPSGIYCAHLKIASDGHVDQQSMKMTLIK